MEITVIGILMIPISLILLFLDIKYLVFSSFLFSAFTATTVLKLTSAQYAVPIFYLFGGMLILKTIYMVMRKHYKINMQYFKTPLTIFVIICAISIVYPIIFSSGVEGYLPDGVYGEVRFGGQNITQLMYLVFGYIIYLCSLIYFNNEKSRTIDITNVFRITVITVLLLGIVQYLLTNEVFNKIFRDNYGMIYAKYRISSVNNEASFLALFITPMMGYFLINYLYNKNVIDILIVIGCIISFIFNRSSSFILGVAVLIICGIVYLVIHYKDLKQQFLKRDKKKDWIIYVGTAFIVLLVILFSKDIGVLIGKLLGSGESGSIRTTIFKEHISIFLMYPFTGVGFGSLRSADLLSTWLSTVGLLGVVPYMYYIITRVKRLYSNVNKPIAYQYIVLLLIANIILLISVPEPYYGYIWMWYAVVEYVLLDKRRFI